MTEASGWVGQVCRAGQVYRVEWIPGTDHLLGVCFCGAQHLEADPIALWEWLYGHPRGHDLLPHDRIPRQVHELPV